MKSIQTLDSNSFQDLSSSMLIELFGIKVYPGGRGKDGGRDAIFEGKIKIPRTDTSIEGRWIIQVKFYNKDQTSQSTWIKKPLNDLKKEIKKFEGKDHKFDSYLLITNVGLTWVEEKGTFDQIGNTIIKEYKKAGFINFEIFDENRIKGFIPLIPLTASHFLKNEMSPKKGKSPCNSLNGIDPLISIICSKLSKSIFEINTRHNPHFRSIISWVYNGKKFYLFKVMKYDQINIIIESYNKTFHNEIIVIYGLMDFLNVLRGKINFLPILYDTNDYEESITNYQNYIDNPLK